MQNNENRNTVGDSTVPEAGASGEPVFVSELNSAPYDIHMRILHHLGRNVTQPGMRVLDAGCNTGELGEQYKIRFDCHVVGVEYDAATARLARPRLDAVIVGDLEKTARSELPAEHFDFVIAADVLEHLVNPRDTVGYLARCLKPGGKMIVSLPNVANYAVRLALLRGRFDYNSTWILAQSHLRFFALHSARSLLTDAGLEIEAVDVSPGLFTLRAYHLTIERVFGRWMWYRRFEYLLSKAFKNLFAYQFVLVARKPGA